MQKKGVHKPNYTGSYSLMAVKTLFGSSYSISLKDLNFSMKEIKKMYLKPSNFAIYVYTEGYIMDYDIPCGNIDMFNITFTHQGWIEKEKADERCGRLEQ